MLIDFFRTKIGDSFVTPVALLVFLILSCVSWYFLSQIVGDIDARAAAVTDRASTVITDHDFPDPVLAYFDDCFSAKTSKIQRLIGDGRPPPLTDDEAVDFILHHCAELFVRGAVMPEEVQARTEIVGSFLDFSPGRETCCP